MALAGASFAGAQAPTVEVALRDGRVWLATALTGDPDRELEATVGGERRKIGRAELLGVHGGPAQPLEMAACWFTGGEVVRGALVAGDATGDHLTMLSPTLGRVEVAVDRLLAFCAPSAHLLRPEQLPLPAGVAEGLLQRAVVGFDLVGGSLHQFAEQGVRFQPDGERAPRWFAVQDFVALRLAGASPRAAPGSAVLLTRTGDRVAIHLRSFTGTAVRCELENGVTVDLPFADLACVSMLGIGTWLSDLEPRAVEEGGFDGEAVHPWRRDAGVLGGPLLAAERTHAKGLGVHSRSRLEFEVPAGMAHLWTRVALDDTAAALAVRASVDVRVLVADAVRFEHKGLQAGQPPRDTGLLAVRPGQVVVLEVDFGKGRDLGDRVAWLSPVFLPAAERR